MKPSTDMNPEFSARLRFLLKTNLVQIEQEPVRLKNLMMDYFGPGWPKEVRGLGLILCKSSYVSRLLVAEVKGTALEKTTLLQKDRQRLQKSLSDDAIDGYLNLWCQIIFEIFQGTINQAEENLVLLVIEPKLRDGLLTPDEETEIHHVAKSLEMNTVRVKKLIEIQLSQTQAVRGNSPPSPSQILEQPRQAIKKITQELPPSTPSPKLMPNSLNPKRSSKNLTVSTNEVPTGIKWIAGGLLLIGLFALLLAVAAFTEKLNSMTLGILPLAFGIWICATGIGLFKFKAWARKNCLLLLAMLSITALGGVFYIPVFTLPALWYLNKSKTKALYK